MKKILIFLLAIILLAGCSNDSNDSSDENKPKDNDEKTSETTKEDKKDEKKVYEVGDTAQITSDTYEFPYEVTVNSFELTTEVEGMTVKERFNAPITEEDKFAVANVTIKNTSDRSFIPNEKISGELLLGDLSINSDDNIFTERNKKLKPGESITGNLVFISSDFYTEESLFLTYELLANTEETKFRLPVSQK